MLDELKPIWRQLVEVYDALDAVMAEIPDERLDWKPSEHATTAGYLAQHVGRANITYANVMRTGERGWRFEAEPGLPREAIVERVRMSREHVRAVFDALAPDRLHAPCADDWAGLGPVVEGPLDALWFAGLMVSHSAYHVGQLNYISRLLEAAEA
jgi:hypothetical protein